MKENKNLFDKDILLVDKPPGFTSFDVLRFLKKKLKVKKIGHGGTLDPLASGLLIVGINKGTKKLKYFLGLPKVYLMEVLLGKKTDTGDLEGKVISEKEVKEVDFKKVKKVLKEMEGEVELEVPKFSAVKYKGKPLYLWAREGKEVPLPKRKTKIFYLKLIDVFKKDKGVVLKIEMKCQKGTYARSVAEKIGEKLNLPSTLRKLRRLKIGDFSVNQAKKLEDLV